MRRAVLAFVATVAGLAVAIPALFGYNYLLARIKNATSDMHVFIDEFITKTAEYYSKGEITAASTMRLPKPNVVSKLASAPEPEKSAPGLDGAVESPPPRSGVAAPSSNFPMKMEIARPRLPDPASEN